MNRFEVVSNEFRPFVVVQFMNQYNVCVGYGVMHNNKLMGKFGSIEEVMQAAHEFLLQYQLVEYIDNFFSESDFQPAPATDLDLDSEFGSNMKNF